MNEQRERDRAIPMRIVITVDDRIAAELICHMGDDDMYWARWCNLRHARGLPGGGAIILRADLPHPFPHLQRGDVREWRQDDISDRQERERLGNDGRGTRT